MNKIQLHKDICLEINETYRRKNSDYGDSVGELFGKLGDISLLTRISDKYNRLMSLLDPSNPKEVNYESIDDTIMDMANYCIIWLMERELRDNNSVPGMDTDGDVINPGMDTDGDVINPGMDTDGDVINPGMDTDGDVINPGMDTDGDVTIPPTVLDDMINFVTASASIDVVSKEWKKILELEEKLNSFLKTTNTNIAQAEENFKNTDKNFKEIYAMLNNINSIINKSNNEEDNMNI